MSATFVRNHTGGQNKTSASAQAAGVLDALVAAGNTLYAATGIDNLASGANPIVSSISVPGGETAAWSFIGRQVEITGTGGTSIVTELWAITTTVDWASSFTPTVTWASTRTAKGVVFKEFSGASVTIRGSVGTNISATGTPSAVVTGGLIGDVAVGALCSESNLGVSADGDTTGGSWSSAHTIATTGGLDAANLQIGLQHKILTSNSDQTFNPSAASADMGVVLALFQPGGGGGGGGGPVGKVIRGGVKKVISADSLVRGAVKKVGVPSVVRGGAKKVVV